MASGSRRQGSVAYWIVGSGARDSSRSVCQNRDLATGALGGSAGSRSVKGSGSRRRGSVSVVRTVPESPHPGDYDDAGSERIFVCSEGASPGCADSAIGLR